MEYLSIRVDEISNFGSTVEECEELAKIIRKNGESASELVSYDDETRVITLSNENRYFSKETIHKLSEFCFNVRVFEEKQSLLKHRDDLHQELQEEQEKVVTDRDSDKKLKLQALTENYEKSKSSIETRNQDQLDEEIKALRTRYRRQLNLELGQLKQEYDQTVEQITNLNEGEKSYALSQVSDRITSILRHVATDIDRTTSRSRALIPSAQTLPLLILSEILDCESLRKACIDTILEDFGEFSRKPQWTCQSISDDTIRTILQRLSTEVLKEFEVEFPRGYLLHLEIESRQQYYRQELADILTEDLLKISKKNSSFPEIIKDEIKRRKEIWDFEISHELHSTGLHVENIEENSFKIRLDQPGCYSLAQASVCKALDTCGKLSFNIKIKSMSRFGSVIGVGFDDPQFLKNGGTHKPVDFSHFGSYVPGSDIKKSVCMWFSQSNTPKSNESTQSSLHLNKNDLLGTSTDLEVLPESVLGLEFRSELRDTLQDLFNSSLANDAAGIIHFNRSVLPGMEGFRKGDILSVTLDMEEHKVEFLKNEELVLKRSVRNVNGYRAWLPTFSLFSSNERCDCEVEVTFVV
eukprot:TRINITY_DN778022_c0_g1_i1.p1 TRINITY_DN778022_c0_g1~~TRINITY_DN778022_c0_g1_i1.p1  ORF type:complete len:581 (-),score=155.35 TRINITY_DN778022_c0_g1_i1:106-1848(-)